MFVSCFAFSANGQTVADSLEQLLKVIEESEDPVITRSYQQKALQLLENTEDKQLQIEYFQLLYQLGLNLQRAGQKDSSRYYYHQVVEYYNTHPKIADQKEQLAKAYNNLGISYYFQKIYPKALDAHFKALELRKEIQSKKLAGSYNNVGLVYLNLARYTEAKKYFKQSLKLKQENHDQAGISNTVNNLGIIARNTQHFDDAKYYYSMAYDLSQAIKDTLKMSNALNNLGRAYFWKQDYEQALVYFEASIELRRTLNQPEGLGDALANAAEVYLKNNQLEQAYAYLKEAAELVETHKIQGGIFQMNFVWAKYWMIKGNSDLAADYYTKYKQASDSVSAEAQAKMVAEIEAKYEAEQQAQEILVLQQQTAIQQLELDRIQLQRRWMVLLTLLLLGVIGLLTWLYHYRTKTNQALSELNQTKDRLFTIIGHDLKNPLVAFRAITQSLSQNLGQMDPSSVLYFIQKLEKSSNRLYLLIQNLLQWALNQSGQLKPVYQSFNLAQLVDETLELFKVSADQAQLELKHQIDPAIQVQADPKMTQTILRNLIDNAIKFTPQQGQIVVRTQVNQQDASKIWVQVQDSGPGMSNDQQNALFEWKSPTAYEADKAKGTGIGLVLCKELSDFQDSHLQVISEVGQGTTFSFALTRIA